MLLLLILIFSPFAFNYFYIWLLYPLTVLLSRWLDSFANKIAARSYHRRSVLFAL